MRPPCPTLAGHNPEAIPHLPQLARGEATKRSGPPRMEYTGRLFGFRRTWRVVSKASPTTWLCECVTCGHPVTRTHRQVNQHQGVRHWCAGGAYR
jgi:hypothetical protein